jgi:phosphatidylglycerophosphate synthase
MPQPDSGSDVYIYKLLKQLTPKYCWLCPNLITIASIAMTLPIILNLYHRRACMELIVLMVLRQLLDCLDGVIARECNKQSRLGELLDHGGDILFHVTISLFVVYRVVTSASYSSSVQQLLLTLFILFACIFVYGVIRIEDVVEKRGKSNVIDKTVVLFHNNSLASAVILSACVYFVNYYSA